MELDDRTADATAGYDTLCRQSPPYVRACFDRVRLMFETGDAAAEQAATALISKYPNEAITQSLVKRLARYYLDAETFDEGRTALAALVKALQNTEIEDTLRFEISRLARAADDTPGEKTELVALIRRHARWQSQLWDDAVWRMAEICRDENNEDEEIVWLKTLEQAQESSRLIGSYTSPYYDDALYRLGEIHLTRGRFAAARRAFAVLAASETSRMQDDGLLGLARVDLAEGQSEDACAKLLEVQKIDGSASRKASSLYNGAKCGPEPN